VESNCISDPDKDLPIKIIDVRFEEGADIFPDEYYTTIGLLKLVILIILKVMERPS